MAVLLALLALLAQDPPEREKASGFTFVRPKGWTRTELEGNIVALTPPGADGPKFGVFIFPGQSNEMTGPAFHDQLYRLCVQQVRVEGSPEKSTMEGWTCSRAKVTNPLNVTQWMTVSTIKSGDRLEGLMIVAASEDVEKTHRPAVDRLLGGIEFPGAKPGGVTIHGLILPVPADWKRKDDPSGSVFLTPPQLEGVLQYVVAVLPPNKIPGTPWEAHKAMAKALLDQAQWTGGEPVVLHRVEGPGLFIKTEAAGRTAAGEGRSFTLFTATHDGVMEAVVGINSIDRNVVDPVLAATRFKDPPKEGARPKIVEAYRRITQRTTINRDGGAPIAGSLLYDRMWFLSNGVVDYSTVYSEGYAASPNPRKVDASLQNGDYGSWKAVGDAIHVTRTAGGKVEIFERRDGGLRGGGKDWEAMPRVDGLKLSGRWELKSPPDEKVLPYHHWIEFTAEGRFKVDGVLKSVAFGDVNPYRPPEKADGAYEIRDWTMFFTFDDGSSWSLDFSTLGKNIQADTSILFRTTVYPKAK